MLICHTSDLHGHLHDDEATRKAIADCDIIVDSGDWMPTKGRRIGERIQPRREYNYQRDWIYKNGTDIAAWAQGKPLARVPGNHDFYEPTAALRSFGIDAIDLCEHWGNTALSNELMYRRETWPALLLCGHIHEGFGVKQWRTMTIVNSATGHHLVQAPKPRA